MILRNLSGQHLKVYAYDSNGDPVTGDAANITAQISKDAGTSAATSDLNPSELDATNQPGWYMFDLTRAETDCRVITLTASSSTGTTRIVPVEQSVKQGQYANVLAVVDGGGTLELTEGVSADDLFNGQIVTIIEGTGRGEQNIVLDSAAATNSIQLQDGWAVTPDLTSVLEFEGAAANVKQVHGNAAQATGGKFHVLDGDGNALPTASDLNDLATQIAGLSALVAASISGTVNDPSPTASRFVGNSELSAEDGFYERMACVFTSGELQGQPRRITAYVGASKTFTFARPFTASPAAGDAFVLVGLIE